MAEYHVGCGAFGIYAGTLNSRNKKLWQNKTECTDEALCAVRDYLVQECLGGLHGDSTSGGYEWTLEDGRVVKLLVEIVDGGDSDEADSTYLQDAIGRNAFKTRDDISVCPSGGHHDYRMVAIGSDEVGDRVNTYRCSKCGDEFKVKFVT